MENVFEALRANDILDTVERTRSEKTHHHGWLARKLFHRSASTYTLKVKSTQKRKSLTRKKSFGMITVPDVAAERTNILKDKTIEETSRLGGLSVLNLPPGYSASKHTIPTCLSAIAAYLCQNGMFIAAAISQLC